MFITIMNIKRMAFMFSLMQIKDVVWKHFERLYANPSHRRGFTVLSNSSKLSRVFASLRFCEHKVAIFDFFYKIKPTESYGDVIPMLT